jgi:predicted GNAT family acetyltransferase
LRDCEFRADHRVSGQTRAEADSIAITPAHRGQGVAGALLERVIGLLRRRGFWAISLNVRPEDRPSGSIKSSDSSESAASKLITKGLSFSSSAKRRWVMLDLSTFR